MGGEQRCQTRPLPRNQPAPLPRCTAPLTQHRQGRAVVAVETPTWAVGSGGAPPPSNQWGLTPSQITSTYIFPGIGENGRGA